MFLCLHCFIDLTEKEQFVHVACSACILVHSWMISFLRWKSRSRRRVNNNRCQNVSWRLCNSRRLLQSKAVHHRRRPGIGIRQRAAAVAPAAGLNPIVAMPRQRRLRRQPLSAVIEAAIPPTALLQSIVAIRRGARRLRVATQLVNGISKIGLRR